MTESVILRDVTMKDVDCLLAWRNDPQTRQASHSMGKVEMEDHVRWLEATIGNTHRLLYIAELNNQAVGSIRADWEDNAWTLSWTVAPEARGKGVAKNMLDVLLSTLSGPFLAEIKTENISSIRVAEQAGFARYKEENGVLFFRR